MKNNKTLYDVMICPHCNSTDCYDYNTDEIEFTADGNGHYYVDCHCKGCGKCFRLYIDFEYSITKAYAR